MEFFQINKKMPSPSRKSLKFIEKKEDAAQTFSLIQWEMERKLLSIRQTAKVRGVDSCCWKALEAYRDTAADSVLAQPLQRASGTAQEIENVMPFGLAIPLLLIHSDITTQVRSDIYKNIHFTSFITVKHWTEAKGQEGRSTGHTPCPDMEGSPRRRTSQAAYGV